MISREPTVDAYVKLKKSEILKFDSDPKHFYKWKSMFE